MRKHLRATVIALAILGMQTSLTGCFGKFALVRKVYGFNETVGDKWLRSLLMFALVVIPVYQVAGLFDYVILNVIEFWTGNNPAAASLAPGQTIEKVATAADGTQVRMVLPAGGEALHLEVTRPGAAPLTFDLRRSDSGAELRDGQGALLSALTVTEDGGALVRDGAGRVLLDRQPDQVAQLGAALRKGGEALLAALEVLGSSKLARVR